jgi:RNA polymerase sigma-70 factor (ECF subfamily)
MVATLPEKQRLVIILKYGEDMAPDEIAAALGMPVRTVWSHLRRAVAMLQEKAAHFLGPGIRQRRQDGFA